MTLKEAKVKVANAIVCEDIARRKFLAGSCDYSKIEWDKAWESVQSIGKQMLADPKFREVMIVWNIMFSCKTNIVISKVMEGLIILRFISNKAELIFDTNGDFRSTEISCSCNEAERLSSIMCLWCEDELKSGELKISMKFNGYEFGWFGSPTNARDFLATSDNAVVTNVSNTSDFVVDNKSCVR